MLHCKLMRCKNILDCLWNICCINIRISCCRKNKHAQVLRSPICLLCQYRKGQNKQLANILWFAYQSKYRSPNLGSWINCQNVQKKSLLHICPISFAPCAEFLQTTVWVLNLFLSQHLHYCRKNQWQNQGVLNSDMRNMWH